MNELSEQQVIAIQKITDLLGESGRKSVSDDPFLQAALLYCVGVSPECEFNIYDSPPDFPASESALAAIATAARTATSEWDDQEGEIARRINYVNSCNDLYADVDD